MIRIKILTTTLLMLTQMGCTHSFLKVERSVASRNGVLLNDGQYPEVVEVHSQSKGVGSGVLIGEDIVLTAYHVLGPLAVSVYYKSFNIELGKYIVKSAEVINRKVLSAEPRKELTLLKLDKKIKNIALPSLINRKLAKGTSLFSVGYGITEKDGTHDFNKRRSELFLERYAHVLSNVSLQALNFSNEETVEMIEVTPGLQNSIPCVGDSGGPLFYKNSDNSLSVLGILSTVHRADELRMGVKPNIESNKNRCALVDLARFVPVHLYRSEILTGVDELSPVPFEVEGFALKRGVGQSLSDSQLNILRSLFAYSASIKGGDVSALHKNLFDSSHLDGYDYLKFIFDKVEFIGLDYEYDTGALAYLRGSSIFLTQAFFDSYGNTSNEELLSIIMHEAYHTISPSHVNCPDDLRDNEGEYLKSFYTGVQLAGRKACDNQIESSYGMNAVVAFNLANSCHSCSENSRKNLIQVGYRFLRRITSSDVKRKILSDSGF